MSKKITILLHVAFWSFNALILGYVSIWTWFGGLLIFLSPGKPVILWVGLWMLLPLFTWLLLTIGLLIKRLTGRYLIGIGVVGDALTLLITWSFFWQKRDVLIGLLGPLVALVFMGLWWLLVSSRLNQE